MLNYQRTSTINYSYWSYLHQLSYRTGASHPTVCFRRMGTSHLWQMGHHGTEPYRTYFFNSTVLGKFWSGRLRCLNTWRTVLLAAVSMITCGLSLKRSFKHDYFCIIHHEVAKVFITVQFGHGLVLLEDTNLTNQTGEQWDTVGHSGPQWAIVYWDHPPLQRFSASRLVDLVSHSVRWSHCSHLELSMKSWGVPRVPQSSSY